LDPRALAVLSEEDAERGEEDGLEGNHQYRDLRGFDWDEVEMAFGREAELMARLHAAADLEEEARQIDDERSEAFEPEDDLWGLDIGVIAATLALSALGATPVYSCNAGGFGGAHVAVVPHIAFYLPAARAAELLDLAEAADVGLDSVEGLARLYGRTDLDLHRFAEVALDRHRTVG
jgi:hypothetical protein